MAQMLPQKPYKNLTSVVGVVAPETSAAVTADYWAYWSIALLHYDP